MTTNIKRWESPEEYAVFLRNIPAVYDEYEYKGKREASEWQGGRFQDGLAKLEQGDIANLAEAQKLIDKLDLAHIFSNDVPVLQPSIAGFIPNVPAVIAGHPEGMFRRGYVDSPSILAPLTVYVNTSNHADLSHEQIVNRGVAALAFVLAMEMVRPVDLYVISIRGHSEVIGGHRDLYGGVIKVASRPMDLGRAAFMLASVNFARSIRGVCVNYMADQTRTGTGPFAFGLMPHTDESEAAYRKLLELQPDDVFIKGGHSYDSLMLNDPVEWVRQMIAKHSGAQENG